MNHVKGRCPICKEPGVVMYDKWDNLCLSCKSVFPVCETEPQECDKCYELSKIAQEHGLSNIKLAESKADYLKLQSKINKVVALKPSTYEFDYEELWSDAITILKGENDGVIL